MCGISGLYLGKNSKLQNRFLEKLNFDLSNKICHRGPDESSFWQNDKENIYFGHNRLKIIDLTENGSQPMFSSKKNNIIIYNGEIYNHSHLKNELISEFGSNILWKGRSDTEVLINAIEFWGIEKTLKKIKGMFAFAVWDLKKKKLILCRDRFGEKPLYFCNLNNGFYFSSEIKSLKNFANHQNIISKENMLFFLEYGFNLDNKSIFQGIAKVPPGTYIEINEDNLNNKNYNFVNYWNSKSVVKESLNIYKNKSIDEICEDTELILENSIKHQLISDVKAGVFLSGGTDSALVASLAQKVSNTQISTYSIGFDVKEYDESDAALSISKKIDTNHNSYIMTSNDLESLIQKKCLFDEPFFDISQFPTYLLTKFASKEVKVCLTGDGGDELFGGYNRHLLGLNILPKLLNFSKYKYPSKVLSSLLKNLNVILLQLIFKIFKLKQLESKTNKILNIVDFKTEEELYQKLLRIENLNEKDDNFTYEKLSNMTDNFMLNDTLKYLPNNILYKVDSLAMLNSLETRAPYLDHDLFKYIWTIPQKIKFNQKNSKYILKKILSKYIDSNYIFKSKMGFDIPLFNWIQNSNNLKKIIKELYFLNNKDISQYFPNMSSKNFEINEKNYLFIWKIAMVKKWLSEQYN